jgi:ribosome-associated protein
LTKAKAGKSRSKNGRARKPGTKDGPGAKEVALAIAEAGLDKKALNVEIIDVHGKVDYADYVIVMSGRSDRQVGAIAKGIQEDLKKKKGVQCLGMEGMPQAVWVLMDFSDVVVHIFHEDTRGYYDLESLWIDAARVEVETATA